MLITVEPLHHTKDATAGKLYVDGEFYCYTLEDPIREGKIPGKTAIPRGEYAILPREHGRFYKLMQERHKWHRGMLQLMNVYDFTDILIHPGNTTEDTEGCLLLGEHYSSQEQIVIRSNKAYKKLYNKCILEAEQGQLLINLKDSPAIVTTESLGKKIEMQPMPRTHALKYCEEIEQHNGIATINDYIAEELR